MGARVLFVPITFYSTRFSVPCLSDVHLKNVCFRFAIHIFLAWLYLCACFSLYCSTYFLRVVLVFVVLVRVRPFNHPSPSHLFIKFKKLFKLIPSRESFGSSFHNFAAPYLSECKPYLVVLTLGMLTVYTYISCMALLMCLLYFVF
jgi:hypothetical protein